MEKFISVQVYRSDLSDSTNGGVTAPNSGNIFVVPCRYGPWTRQDLDQNETIVELIPAINIGCPHFRPAHFRPHQGMMGGNFVYSHDSRYRERYGYQPIAVHDRLEF
mgnify:FL=1